MTSNINDFDLNLLKNNLLSQDKQTLDILNAFNPEFQKVANKVIDLYFIESLQKLSSIELDHLAFNFNLLNEYSVDWSIQLKVDYLSTIFLTKIDKGTTSAIKRALSSFTDLVDVEEWLDEDSTLSPYYFKLIVINLKPELELNVKFINQLIRVANANKNARSRFVLEQRIERDIIEKVGSIAKVSNLISLDKAFQFENFENAKLKMGATSRSSHENNIDSNSVNFVEREVKNRAGAVLKMQNLNDLTSNNINEIGKNLINKLAFVSKYQTKLDLKSNLNKNIGKNLINKIAFISKKQTNFKVETDLNKNISKNIINKAQLVSRLATTVSIGNNYLSNNNINGLFNIIFKSKKSTRFIINEQKPETTKQILTKSNLALISRKTTNVKIGSINIKNKLIFQNNLNLFKSKISHKFEINQVGI